MGAVEQVGDLLGGTGQLRHADGHFLAGLCRLCDAGEQGVAVLENLVRLLAIDLRHLLEHVRESGAAIAGATGEIGAAPEGGTFAIQEHGERPAARLAQMVESGHVDLVHVGALFPGPP